MKRTEPRKHIQQNDRKKATFTLYACNLFSINYKEGHICTGTVQILNFSQMSDVRCHKLSLSELDVFILS
jgi:hypothetical protein